jgi:4-hydroxymandelate oxidase
VAQPLNLHEYEALAKAKLSGMAFDYYLGGANDEFTTADNLREWQRIRLVPRVLAGVDRIDITTTVVGQVLSMPVITAPCGFNLLAHPSGECGIARAASLEGTISVASTVGTQSMEEIAASCPGPKWFQLYCYRDKAINKDLVQRAEAAGYSALCLTVDVPYIGRRERDLRNCFVLPEGMSVKNTDRYSLSETSHESGGSFAAKLSDELWDHGLTWEIVSWLRSITDMPIVLKGILSAEDARLAVEHGASGIVVSNHGGRQLDGVIGTTRALQEIVDEVAGKIDVLVDGGIRRGTDVVKAVALGAKAVMIGRPIVWGLAVDGEAGVRHVLQLIRDEIVLAMALVGRTGLKELNRSILRFEQRPERIGAEANLQI